MARRTYSFPNFPTTVVKMENHECYSPTWLIEGAREVMDAIDLDVASCETANTAVRAAQFYAKAINGLNQRWRGRVYLNPPFGCGVRDWLEKLRRAGILRRSE